MLSQWLALGLVSTTDSIVEDPNRPPLSTHSTNPQFISFDLHNDTLPSANEISCHMSSDVWIGSL